MVLARLLAARAAIGARTKVRKTALHYAAQGGHAAAVEVLLRARADLGARSNTGTTALDLAQKSAHTLVVAQLERARTEKAREHTVAVAILGASAILLAALVRRLVQSR